MSKNTIDTEKTSDTHATETGVTDFLRAKKHGVRKGVLTIRPEFDDLQGRRGLAAGCQ